MTLDVAEALSPNKPLTSSRVRQHGQWLTCGCYAVKANKSVKAGGSTRQHARYSEGEEAAVALGTAFGILLVIIFALYTHIILSTPNEQEKERKSIYPDTQHTYSNTQSIDTPLPECRGRMPAVGACVPKYAN